MNGVLDRLNPIRLLQDGGSFWLPSAASASATGVDRLFYFIFWIAFFFFMLIVVLMTVFVLRYRKRRRGETTEKAPTHHTPLELAWTGIPLLLVFVIFYFGLRGFLDLSTPPANAYEIQVTAQRWKWTFTYPNGYVDEDLHVPVDTPVRLVMTSEDVIHGFYVPDFRVKHDVVPGRYNTVWFKATGVGSHDLFCTQYCGTGHSQMHAMVVVHAPGEFEKWLDSAANLMNTLPPAEVGARLYKTRGCAQCHSIDGKAGTGPTFQNLFGSHVLFNDGKSYLADENYIRECITDPQSKNVAGFQNVMPTFKGRLKDQEITAIIAYMKTLKDEKAGTR